MEIELKVPKTTEEIAKKIEEKIAIITKEMDDLSKMFKEGRIEADVFVERYNELKKRKEELEKELKKYTLI